MSILVHAEPVDAVTMIAHGGTAEVRGRPRMIHFGSAHSQTDLTESCALGKERAGTSKAAGYRKAL
jgi:hypothetical protein